MFDRFRRPGVVLAAATAALLAGTGVAGAATIKSADSFNCPKEYLCLHLYDVKGYHWVKFKTCAMEGIGQGEAVTWFINNQIPGTVSTFYYSDGHTWKTPPAFSKGEPGAPFYWGAPLTVQVC